MPNDETVSSTESSPPQPGSNPSFHVSLIGGHNIWEWIFLVIGTWNVALLLASSGVSIAQCDIYRSLQSPAFTTEVLVILVSLIALLFAIYGVHEEHQFDIYLHVAFVLLADFFCFLASDKKCHHCFKRVCFYVALGMSVMNGVIAYKATHARDWLEFRIVGASESLAAMYKRQCAFLSLLKFDSLFVIICALYSFPLTLEFRKETNLYLLIGLVVIYSLMSWCCGKITVYKEDKYLASGFVVLCITYPCLIIYQIYMSNHKSLVENNLFHYSAQYIGVIIMLIKLLLMHMMVLTCRTFGYGLNTRSLNILKKWLDHPTTKKSGAKENATWANFMKEFCHVKCANKTKEQEYTYKDIYRF